MHGADESKQAGLTPRTALVAAGALAELRVRVAHQDRGGVS
jgi:hypothetical protein